jgi:predicted NUDIX family NTP pyrophosphohydrolase
VKTFAAFVVAKANRNEFCATTRDGGKIGLPGGKVEGDELPWVAAQREAKEEGWIVQVLSELPIHQQEVDGKLVQWFAATKIKKLQTFKEKGRIRPITANIQKVMASGMGNENLKLL